ncbi:hypothetical protein J422_03583 [Methanocaldococcus villosus KIN24-T80]|uniref:Uncharacterized protein n=1 Tax=Methanocaldococcus villosus KIN24-T80 TaxID=1069083 RepID=N6VYJ7_9EURY|nr:DsrE family protein [Methanocaldococcus villosus]ENN96197.1 hypothetical protein J422_03583 [Methanocaldococcus villosus KIN24-T80]
MKTAFLIFNFLHKEQPNIPLMFHILLFAGEMKEKGDDVKIILEGEAVQWAKLLLENDKLKNHFEKVKDCFIVCEACAAMFNVKDEIKDHFKLENDLYGHISLKKYMDEGYRIISF